MSRRGGRQVGMVRLVAPGLAMVAVAYGLARFAYGLLLPEMRRALDLDALVLGVIGAGSYAAYGGAIVVSLVYTARVGSRAMVAAAGISSVVGMVLVAVASGPWSLAVGVLVAGLSSGLVSPPMADAVALGIERDRHDRANALINSGTSVGIIVSGPVALWVAGQWRLAWVAFAAAGLVVLVWNLAAMPGRVSRPDGAETAGGMGRGAPEDRSGISFRRLVGRRSAPLLAASVGVGLASAAYWTFSTELVVWAGDVGQTGATVFWVVLGVFGLAGGLAGDLSQRFGIGRSLGAALLAMAGAIGLLAVAPGVPLLAYASAALFGTTYITLTGILLVWSVGVFNEQPSAGLGISFLLLATGQVLGSSLAGILAGAIDLRTTFLVFAGVAALAAGTGIWTGDTGDARGSEA